MEHIKIFDKTFKPYISHDEIIAAIDKVAHKMNEDFKGTADIPVILCVLNGSIMFTAELMQRLDFQCELASIKLSSYSGTKSTGCVQTAMGLTCDVTGRKVIVVEDIVDTGNTIVKLNTILKEAGASEIIICTLLFKPDSYDKDIRIDYIAKEIPNDFIVGFGLDYDGLGRGLKEIYVIDEKQGSEMKYFILFGPPGAGKGTQAAKMREKYSLRHISTGDLLRKEIAQETELGKKAKALIEAGNLVPDEVVIGMIKNVFDSDKDAKGFLLDGFPRTEEQAVALDKILKDREAEVTSVLSLMIDDDEVVRRIKRRAEIENRADDADEATIRNRVMTYHEKTEPVINHYRSTGKYREIDGSGKIDDVFGTICGIIDRL